MTIIEAVEAFKPNIEERYIKHVTYLYDKMVADLGTELKNVGNDWTWARTYTNTVKPNCTSRQLDFNKLSINAKQYAATATNDWIAKINNKLGDIENVEVRDMTATGFTIVGSKNGHRISITQDMIVNVSGKGTLFNQFPSRIYVDTRFVSEATYKQMFQ